MNEYGDLNIPNRFTVYITHKKADKPRMKQLAMVHKMLNAAQ